MKVILRFSQEELTFPLGASSATHSGEPTSCWCFFTVTVFWHFCPAIHSIQAKVIFFSFVFCYISNREASNLRIFPGVTQGFFLFVKELRPTKIEGRLKRDFCAKQMSTLNLQSSHLTLYVISEFSSNLKTSFHLFDF